MTKQRKHKIMAAVTLALLVLYVVGYIAFGHRLGAIAAPSVHRRMAAQERSFTKLDFDYQWQASIYRPMVWLEDLVREEEVYVTIGLWRNL